MDNDLPLAPSDRADSAKSSAIGGSTKGSQALDSMSTEWTDEKHSLYLNSMEESFVNQLYSSEYCSKDLLGWLSRTQKNTNSFGSDPNNLSSGQFKVLRRGCWENLKFERAKSRANIENESRRLSVNPWIQHFRSPSIGKEPHPSSDQVNHNENANHSIHLVSQRHGREATSSRQPPPFCSHLYHQDSVGSNTEVSDQNFVDMELEGVEQLGKKCRKKRARAAISRIKDQVVPSGKPLVGQTLNESSAFLKDNNGEGSSKNSEEPNVFHHLEPKPSLFKDQEQND